MAVDLYSTPKPPKQPANIFRPPSGATKPSQRAPQPVPIRINPPSGAIKPSQRPAQPTPRRFEPPGPMEGARQAAAKAAAARRFTPSPQPQLPAYDPTFMSMVDSTRALQLMSGQIDLSQAIAQNSLTRAGYQGQVDSINAGAAAAQARLKEELAYTGDVKGYLAKKLMLDTQTENLKAEALQNSGNINERQVPLYEGKTQDVEAAYANDLDRLRSQEVANQHGYQNNLSDQSRAQGAAGVATSHGTREDVQRINNDYSDAMAKIGQDRTNVTIKHAGDIRDLTEAKAVINDNRDQCGIDMQVIGNAKQQLNNEYQKGLLDLNHDVANARISASEAAAQAAAKRKEAAAANAQLNALDQAARNRAAVQETEANNAADAMRQNAAPNQIPGYVGSAPQAGSNPAPGQGYSLPNTAPFAPDITYYGNPNNPLGISDAAYKSIADQARWEARGDPTQTMMNLANYVKWYGSQIINQRNAARRPTNASHR